MRSVGRSLPSVMSWLLLGSLLITSIGWAEGFIIHNVRGDAVYAIQPDDTKPTKLIEGFPARPSPDGRLLAVWRPEQVFELLDIKTGGIVKQIPLQAWLFLDFAWSPDREWIAYTGHVGDKAEIFLISVQSGTIRQLTFHQGRKRRLVWASDSRSIFYGEIDAPRGAFWEISIDGQGQPKEHRRRWVPREARCLSRLLSRNRNQRSVHDFAQRREAAASR